MVPSLEEMLESRDARARHQRKLLQDNPGKTLICLTVVMPGPVKRSRQSLLIAMAAMTAIIQRFGTDQEQVEAFDLATGFEAYLLTSASVVDAKRAVCRIEEEHPLGRLFDIDVIGRDGIPVERASLGLPPRSCLICGRPARECMRSGRHGYEDLLKEIDRRIDGYVS